MHVLYLLAVWLHLIAAITWIGGMFFLVLVVVPWLRHGNRASGAVFLRETGVRFRNVGWACFAVLQVGPSATLAIETDARSGRAETLRKRASLLGRANALLALVLVALGVVIVRGWPF